MTEKCFEKSTPKDQQLEERSVETPTLAYKKKKKKKNASGEFLSVADA